MDFAHKKVLVLGGYGLIGAACVSGFLREGHQVGIVGRSPSHARGLPDGVTFHKADLADLSANDYHSLIASYDVIINASGALQESPRDNLRAIHTDAVARLIEAMENTSKRLVHISAIGASPHASTAFLRTKAEGDAIVQQWDGDWIIFRPALVLSPKSYGGTGLIRAAAGVPLVHFSVFPDTPVMTIHVDDLAQAVIGACAADAPRGKIFDLSEPQQHKFEDIIFGFRKWLGFHRPLVKLPVPRPVLQLLGWAADITGLLGWRSPLRTTAIQVLGEDLVADPQPWLAHTGKPLRGFDKSMQDLPSTVQERWFARLYMMLPLTVVTLSLFWIMSGIVALLDPASAQAVLTERGVTEQLASAAVYAGSFVDIGLGAAVLFRPLLRWACAAMIVMSLTYIAGAAVLVPDLWLDPMGPMLKVLPATLAPLFLMAIAEDR